MEISKDINDYIPELIKILNIRNDFLSLKELRTKNLVINNKNITDVVYSRSLTDDQKISKLKQYFGDRPELAQKIIDTLNGKPIVDDFPGFAPAPSASADDAVSPTGAPADDSAEYGNHRINISSDKDKTRMLIQELRRDNMLTIDDPNKNEVISMLESTPEMLEFRGDDLVLVHSYYSKASQFLTRDKKICDKSKKVVDFLNKYYTSKQIKKIVRLTDKLQNKCLPSGNTLYDDAVFSRVPNKFPEVMGGSKSRRRHHRHRKPARKTHRRRGHGHGRGCTHKSKSKSKRQIRARKYKKNTYKRCK